MYNTLYLYRHTTKYEIHIVNILNKDSYKNTYFEYKTDKRKTIFF